MMTREEAAVYLHTTPRQIDRLRKAGRLRSVKIGKRAVRILRSSVEVKDDQNQTL
jgi:excisionase family DNA binding protein